MSQLNIASTGITGLDQVLDSLRLGDNVVWQVDSIEDYRFFARRFARQALQENRRIVYCRFGQHPDLLADIPGIMIYTLDAGAGFEAFSTRVHQIASQEGPGVYYVFDCLSDLLSAWANDLMIGNFFRVTCPYLFELDTIAYFTVLRNRNSFQTIARIRETTQLLLDVYASEGHLYVHPLKVLDRYSPTMFLPHLMEGESLFPLTSSSDAAHFFSRMQQSVLGDAERKLDYWDRVFIEAAHLQERVLNGDRVTDEEYQDMLDRLCFMLIGRDEQILDLARRYLSLADLLEVRRRLVGSGFIGGKSAGMLLARSILTRDCPEGVARFMEPHDSFYIGSDVYYTYLVENGCWSARIKQKDPANYYSAAAELREHILAGTFPAAIQEQLYQLLEYFGQSPIIVRSSSLLEDGFGNAFAGKYDSVFCVNQGGPQERYHLMERAVRQVYASTMNEDALAYRKQRHLDQNDEQMALLVQRVSGAHHSHYFFPDFAGVAMSQNPYAWRSDMDPGAGMVRLVLGLGTRAVDRVDDDYPRVIALDKPLAVPQGSREEARQFSQHRVDVLDTVLNDLTAINVRDLASLRSHIPAWDLAARYDAETTDRLRSLGDKCPESWVLTFERLVSDTPFVPVMNTLLEVLEKAYQYPVDTEFTVNFTAARHLQVNVLQCRPLQVLRANHLAIPADKHPDMGNIIFASSSFMGSSQMIRIGAVLYISAEYTNLSHQDKYQAARLTGRINRMAAGQDWGPLMLVGPGRWGTSTPSLGVPVSFAEISNAAVLVEAAGEAEGFMPELSFGTHFFQDLVETGIVYSALFPDRPGQIFAPEQLDILPDTFASLFPDQVRLQPVMHFYQLEEGKKPELWVRVDQVQRTVQAYFL